MKRLLLAVLVALSTTGCGRKWEQLWGQDTKPETRWIPMTPDTLEFNIGPVEPWQWGDARFRKAKYLSVWACRADNVCTGLPDMVKDPDAIIGYVLDYNNSIMTVYNLSRLSIGGVAPSKLRFQLVMQ